MFVGVGFIHPAVVIFSVPTPGAHASDQEKTGRDHRYLYVCRGLLTRRKTVSLTYDCFYTLTLTSIRLIYTLLIRLIGFYELAN